MLDQTLETESEGFRFTFSASTIANFTEPVTPPYGRSPSFKLVELPTSAGSHSSSPGHIITPPATDYSSSSSYQPTGELESDSDNMSAPSSPSPRMKQHLPSASSKSEFENSPAKSTVIAAAVTSSKRTFIERKTFTPPVSPVKKKAKSAIRTALEGSPKGLMKFLKKCTPTEHHIQVQRATEEENEQYESREQVLDVDKARKAERTREEAKVRQQKHRRKMYDQEIEKGERSPGGSKHAAKVNT